jgi:oxygen-independent coproporphyrinogen-3 oxidase
MTQSHSLYLHIPFCRRRCAYCDFNTYAGQAALLPAYVDALCREIRAVAASASERLSVHTIFFGGGTPSLLTAEQFKAILQTIHNHFVLSDVETSLEANPGTLTFGFLRDLRALGFNRLSLGVQSAHPDELYQLERIHNFFDVIESVKWARQAGFDNLNLDLIFGLPEQSLDRWQATVKLALGLRPEHLSLYALTLEHGTPFGRWSARGLLPSPDPDLAADMYEWAGEFLVAEGYLQYEISNWAKPGCQCRHNLQYWRNQPYLGFGAGAHGCAAGMRYSNVLRIKTYIERLTSPFSLLTFPISPATVNHQHITPKTEMQETMITGLRLTQEGVSAEGFRARFGVELREVFGKEIDELVTLGLLEWADLSPHPPFPEREGGRRGDRSLRLTRRGRLLGNQVFMSFVG